MRQYIDVAQDLNGNALVGATCTVRTYPAGALASIFSDNGLTPIGTSIVTADVTGQFSFFAADGDYTLQLSFNGAIYKTQSPVSLFDGAAQLTYADTGAANAYASANSALEKALRVGLRASILAANASTGASTYAYNTLAAKPLIVPGGSAIGVNTILVGGIYWLEYDGTSWQLRGQSAAISSASVIYPQTALELTAGVTPVNFNVPSHTAIGEIQVDRYGNNANPGTTSMAAAFQSAINVAKAGGGVVTWGPTAPYLLDAPMDCTCAVGGNVFGYTIRGLGQVSAVSVNPPYRPGVIFKHNGVAGFDCTGNLGLLFDGGSYGTDTATFPKTGFLFARNSDKRSQVVQMRNVRIIGSFSVACVYNYGSEDDNYHACWFQNHSTLAGTKTMLVTSTNAVSGIPSLTSTFTTIASGSLSCIDHNLFGCQHQNDGGSATSDCIYLDAVDTFKTYGGWALSASSSVNGRALVAVDCTNGASNYCVIDGMTGESAAALQANGVQFFNGPATPIGWNITNCKIAAATDILAASANITLDSMGFSGNSAFGCAIAIAGILQNSSNFNYDVATTAIGTSTNNTLIGQTERLTVTTRTNDNWIDTGTTNKTFAPGVATGVNNFTAVGAITQRGKCLYNGSKVDFSIILAAATSIAWTTGATIPTLPGVATDTFSCDVTDDTAGTLIGRGLISAGSGHSTVTLTVAQTATGHAITISGSYFVA